MAERKTGEERREELLESALEVIHEDGFDSLTVRRLAEKVGISEAAVYRHFDDKEEVVRKTAERVFSTEVMNSEKEFEDPEDMLENFFKTLFGKLEEKPKITAIIFHGEIFAEYPEIREMFREHRSEKKSQIERMIESGQKSGDFDETVDPSVAATIITGSVMMTVKEWREDGFEHSLTDRAEELSKEISAILEK